MPNPPRRDFFRRLLKWGGLSAVSASGMAAQVSRPPASIEGLRGGLDQLCTPRPGRRRRASSWDRAGKNFDNIPIEAKATATLADIRGAGCIRHIWITVEHQEPHFLRKLVLKAYWDGETTPSVEVPLGDFFGVGHARATNYSCAPLNMVTGGRPQTENRAAMNCFFPMPFAKGARIAIENQGQNVARRIFYYVDYDELPSIDDGLLRFHAQFRSERPTAGSTVNLSDRKNGFQETNQLVNLDGKENYTLLEAAGRGHYVGCVLSIDHINPIPGFGWFGEGDDMIYIDGETSPSLIGTGTEDYFGAAWGYPGGFNPMPYHGISLAGPTDGTLSYSGKWTMYRFHVEDPVMFEKSVKVTIEHGHANVQANDYSSVAYWYQTEPHQAFPALTPVDQRLPFSDAESTRSFWKTF